MSDKERARIESEIARKLVALGALRKLDNKSTAIDLRIIELEQQVNDLIDSLQDDVTRREI